MKKKAPFDKGKGPAKQGAGAFKAFFSKPGKGRGSEKVTALSAKPERERRDNVPPAEGEDGEKQHRRSKPRSFSPKGKEGYKGPKPFSDRPEREKHDNVPSAEGKDGETQEHRRSKPRSFSPKGKTGYKGPKPFSTRPVQGKSKDKPKAAAPVFSESEPMRLNKYLAHAGIASRRAADAIIAAGEVMVNGTVVMEMGHKVMPGDVVSYQGKQVKPVGKRVYILLNKPRDYITTTSDEKDRRTVMELVSKATEERIYPVGRLDRNTTGLLLLTNDGELTQKLMHPSHQIKKIYLAVLDKPLAEADMEKIRAGLILEDGKADIDVIDYADRNDKKQVGVELHIGKNRIVRRIFEHLGYDVVRLDRVYYGGLTKKDLPRGRWRNLEEKEVIMLKHFT